MYIYTCMYIYTYIYIYQGGSLGFLMYGFFISIGRFIVSIIVAREEARGRGTFLPEFRSRVTRAHEILKERCAFFFGASKGQRERERERERGEEGRERGTDTCNSQQDLLHDVCVLFEEQRDTSFSLVLPLSLCLSFLLRGPRGCYFT